MILYTDEQIQDVRRFCCGAPLAESTVLGVDKTFNLGQFHVAVNWKPQPLLDLVEKLAEVVQSQYEEVERALINTGNYKLAPTFERFSVHRDTWRVMPEEKRQRHLMRFCTTPKTSRNTVISSDETTSVVVPSHGGKKKGQITRKRPNRTR